MTSAKAYSRKSWLQYLAGLGVIIAGANLVVQSRVHSSSQYLLWMGIIAFGLGVLDLVFKFRTPAIMLSPWSITWYRVLLWPKLEITFSGVKSWRAEGRKLFFIVLTGRKYKIDLFELSEADRADIRERLPGGTTNLIPQRWCRERCETLAGLHRLPRWRSARTCVTLASISASEAIGPRAAN
jgi:hypothetical protein